MALIDGTILIEHRASGNVKHEDRQWRIRPLRPFREPIHLITLASQSAECQVVHHDDGSGWLAILLATFVDDTLPVSTLYAALHAQLVMEVGILIPEMIDANRYGHYDTSLKNPVDEFGGLF